MWVSGPTASVRTISITARKVLVGICASAFVLVAFGVLLHFIGFRIAIEMSPSLARSLGGVTTEAEQQKVEAVYRERLDNLRQTLNTTVQEIRQLETLKTASWKWRPHQFTRQIQQKRRCTRWSLGCSSLTKHAFA